MQRLVRTACTVLLLPAAALAAPPRATADGLWPLAASYAAQCKDPAQLAAGFTIVLPDDAGGRLAASAARALKRIAPGASPHGRVRKLEVIVGEPDDGAPPQLGSNSSYGLDLGAGSDTVYARAPTVFGAMYALETFLALLGTDGALADGCFALADGPNYAHRGLLLDVGRRFFPVALVRAVLDGMALSKLNVLHFHLSDFGGYKLASAAYPALTAHLVDSQGRRLFYSAADVAEIVAYASARGIRVVPEVDVPGHASAFAPLRGPAGVQFCSDPDPVSLPSQLYDDPQGRTWRVISTLLDEAIALFPDVSFHVGADETQYHTGAGPCAEAGSKHHSNAAQLEEKIQRHVLAAGKAPRAFEEAYLQTKVAKPNVTTLDAWAAVTAVQLARRGFASIELHGNSFYLDHPKGPGGPWSPLRRWDNFSTYWRAIGRTCEHGEGGENATCLDPATSTAGRAQRALLLGGEVSFWSDHYCDRMECHSSKTDKDHPRGCAWWLSGFNASAALDAQFAASAMAMLFPRAAIAAGSFWRHDASLDLGRGGPLWRRLAAHDSRLRAAAINGCPVFAGSCPLGCTEAAACGVPYAHPPSAELPLEKACPYHF